MISRLLQMNSLQQTTQSRIDNMDEIAYAFYLAYGMDVENEELSSLLDVEMYNNMKVDVLSAAVEESYRDFLRDNSQEVEVTSSGT